MKNLIKLFSLLLLITFLTNCSSSKDKLGNKLKKPNAVVEDIYVPHLKSDRKTFFKGSLAEDKWVDSVYNQMPFNEKVGQLFMVAAYSNKDSVHVNGLDKLISEYKIGGLIFFQGGPVRQAKLTNRFQSKSKLPLFIGIDAEWGLSMRLD